MTSWQAAEPVQPQKSPVLGLQRSGLRADQCAVGVYVAELVVNRHAVLP
jgi:hypothetical protein